MTTQTNRNCPGTRKVTCSQRSQVYVILEETPLFVCQHGRCNVEHFALLLLKKSSITFQKGGKTKKNGRLGPPSSAAHGRPNAHRIDRSHLPGPRVHLEAPPRPDNNRVSPRAHARTPPPLHTTATPPFAPQREHTQQGASVTRGQGFRLLPAQAS